MAAPNKSLEERLLDLAEAAHARNNEVIKDVVVSSYADIRALLADLHPNASSGAVDEAELSTVVVSSSGKFNVKVNTKAQSKRDIVFSALEMIRNREIAKEKSNTDIGVLVNGRMMCSPFVVETESYSWVDPLLKRWFGAYRDGQWICWDVGDYTYRYDIFEHKLFKASRVHK